jgi:hypothetical protein
MTVTEMIIDRLFPNIPHQEVGHIFQKIPILNIRYLFDVNSEELKISLKTNENKVPRGMSFAAYEVETTNKLSQLAKKAGEADPELHHLDVYADYIINLSEEDYQVKLLFDFYEKLRDFLLVRISEHTDSEKFSLPMKELLLSPILIWSEKIDGGGAELILGVLDSVVHELISLFNGRSISAHLLEQLNGLIYCIFLIGVELGFAVHPVVITQSLQVYRKASSESWAMLPRGLKVQYGTLMLTMFLQHFPIDQEFKTKHGFSDRILMEFRDLMEDLSGNSVEPPLEAHFWVFRWIRDKVDVELFSARTHFRLARDLLTLSDSEKLSVVELSRRFSAYRYPVTAERLTSFLRQFGSTTRIRGTLRILESIKFYPLWELAETVERLLLPYISPDRDTKLVIAPLGDQAGSTAIIKYLASHSKISDRLEFVDDVSQGLRKTKSGEAIHFIDDCLISGTQVLSYFGDLMGVREHKPHHTIYALPLNPEDRCALLDRRLQLSYCCVMDFGLNRFMRDIPSTGLDAKQVAIAHGNMEWKDSKVFDPMGPVRWDNPAQREELKEFASHIGYSILSNRSERKNWNEFRRRESALGYSDSQRVLVFPYNVPKTTLTMLWEQGNDDQDWTPLFRGAD